MNRQHITCEPPFVARVMKKLLLMQLFTINVSEQFLWSLLRRVLSCGIYKTIKQVYVL